MNWLDLVRKYFPGISDEEADFILWERTAYPMAGVETVEEQLKELREGERWRITPAKKI